MRKLFLLLTYLYGMCPPRFLALANEEIQLPKARRLELMRLASTNVSRLHFVRFVFSLPAKSTKQIRPEIDLKGEFAKIWKIVNQISSNSNQYLVW